MSLPDLRRRYVDESRPLPVEIERALREDPRCGARAILAAVERRRRDNRSEGQRLRVMLRYERELWAAGMTRIAGCDEVGMSPLAGPVVAAAVIMPIDWKLPGVDDSKKVDPEDRERLAPIIRGAALALGVGVVEVEDIDRVNIYHAGLLAMRRAIDQMASALVPELVLLDGNRRLPSFPYEQRTIVKGDEKSLSIAAASIVAKVARDRRMIELAAQYPGYGFERHKGYPVKEHYRALRELGPCAIHRRSFPAVHRACEGAPIDGDAPVSSR